MGGKLDYPDEGLYFDKSAFSLLQKIFEAVHIPIILIGRDENILYVNDAYADYLFAKDKAYEGRHIKDFISNSRMPVVMATKKAEIAHYHLYIDGPAAGREAIVHRIPILDKDQVVGCFGMVMFKTIDDLQELAVKNRQLKEELQYYRQEIKAAQNTRYDLDDILGESAAVREMKEQIAKYSSNRSAVLILGESGSGKELVAHSIHNCSPRRKHPFIRLNCAAIPDNLFESEFFGFEDGAFTGAAKGGKKGKFELADKGTLFLDEICELPLFMQAKLLRVLQEKEINRIGGNHNINVDVRVVAATNRDIEAMVREKKFREDLYFRLNILTIRVPSLRERIDDLDILAAHFLNTISRENGVYKRIRNDVVQTLKKYRWSGNIRELYNTMERMYFSSEDGDISLGDIPPAIHKNFNLKTMHPGAGLDTVLGDMEREMVAAVMEETNHNISRTAEILKISRPRLYRILERMNPVR